MSTADLFERKLLHGYQLETASLKANASRVAAPLLPLLLLAAVVDDAAAAAAAAVIGGHDKSASPINIKMLSRTSDTRTLNRILCV